MAVSKYFNHTSHEGQQGLINDLIIEAIQTRGIDVLYLPREVIDDNDLLNEANQSLFQHAHVIEMYVEEVTNYNGMGDLFKSFGSFSMEDSATLLMSQKRFKEEIPDLEEPRSKDLIYIPYADLMFEVDKKLEDESFMQWGQNYVFRVKCTKFKFGGEDFDLEEESEEMFDFNEALGSLEHDLAVAELTPQVQPTDIANEIEISPSQPVIDTDIGDVL